MTVSEVRRHWAFQPFVRSRRIHQTLPAGGSSAEADSATLLLTTGLSERRPPHQRLTRIGPAVRVSVPRVVRFQEGGQPLLELRRRSEVTPFQETPRQHAEPYFYLVEPRAMP